MDKKTIAVVGAGKGMGLAIAKIFGEHGFKPLLMARSRKNLDECAAALRTEDVESSGYIADASDTTSITKAFDAATSEYGAIDVLAYNAAYMTAGKASELLAAELMAHYQVDVAGAMHCVRQVLPGQTAKKSGALLFTGGLFGVHPNYNGDYACISVGKAALRALANMLHDELKPSGIYAGIVEIMGVVGSSARFAPENIAKAYWQLYESQDSFEYIYE